MNLKALTTQPWLIFHSDELTIGLLEMYDADGERLVMDLVGLDFQRTLYYIHSAKGDFQEVDVPFYQITNQLSRARNTR